MTRESKEEQKKFEDFDGARAPEVCPVSPCQDSPG